LYLSTGYIILSLQHLQCLINLNKEERNSVRSKYAETTIFVNTVTTYFVLSVVVTDDLVIINLTAAGK